MIPLCMLKLALPPIPEHNLSTRIQSLYNGRIVTVDTTKPREFRYAWLDACKTRVLGSRMNSHAEKDRFHRLDWAAQSTELQNKPPDCMVRSLFMLRERLLMFEASPLLPISLSVRTQTGRNNSLLHSEFHPLLSSFITGPAHHGHHPNRRYHRESMSCVFVLLSRSLGMESFSVSVEQYPRAFPG